MKKYTLVALLFVVPMVVGITSCKRSFDKDFDGLAICPSESFAVTTPLVLKSTATSSTTSVNMSTSSVTLTATFSEVVSWTIEVTGGTTGAFKSFTGTSNQINLIWSGEPDSAPFFGVEQVNAVLKVSCKTEAFGSAFINFTALPSFSAMPGYISNMDNNRGALDNASPKISSSFKSPGDPGYAGSPEGGAYLSMVGNDPVTPQWYYGQYNNLISMGALSGLNSDPSTVYYNVYLKGIAGSQAQIIFSETVPGAVDDKARKVNFDLSPTWTMYTVKLSDIGVNNPQNITKINTNLGASPVQTHTGELDMDLVIFTNNGPLLK